MNIWQTMEMVHSRSYTHIIKNVYADPSDVFDNILDDDKILSRARSVTQHMMSSSRQHRPMVLANVGTPT